MGKNQERIEIPGQNRDKPTGSHFTTDALLF